MFALKQLLAQSLGALLVVGASGTGAVWANPGQQDQGAKPWVVDIETLTTGNPHFRSTWWTGKSLQMTVMSLQPGQDIGLEVHERGDQFIRVEQGQARVQMGPSADALSYDQTVSADWAIFIPEGAWHNITNTGSGELKVYVIYAPPEHPAGTLHPLKPAEG